MNLAIAQRVVSLLEQENQRQHAKQQERECQPGCVSNAKIRDSHQLHNHQQKHERDAAALDDPVTSPAFKSEPEEEGVEKEKACAFHNVRGT